MVDARRLRTVLAVDAIATVVAGLAVSLRPGLLTALVPEGSDLPPVGQRDTARWIGLGVAGFGAGKGLLYAVALVRYGGSRAAESTERD